MKKLALIIATLTLLLATTGCDGAAQNQTITVYTTNYAQKYIVQEIGKELVNSYSIYDNEDEYTTENTEFVYTVVVPSTFTFESHPEKTSRVLKADLFIYNGYSTSDKSVINQLVDLDKDENVTIFDATRNASTSTINSDVELKYNNTVVSSEILNVTKSSIVEEMYWLSPIEMMNTAQEIYNKLIEQFPNKKTELKANYDDLIYDLNSLYAIVEDVNSETYNNIIVSDTAQLNVLKLHYIQNVYTDNKQTVNYQEDETNEAYLNNIAQYMTINPETSVQTTDSANPNFFDLNVVQSVENYQNGFNFLDIMKNNYQVLDQVLQN